MSNDVEASLCVEGGYQDYSWRIVSWDDAQVDASLIRNKVFIEEQGVPLELEYDEFDVTAWHVLMYSPTGDAVGTARVLALGDGYASIGRVAVLPVYRGEGLGRLMILELMAFARSRGYIQISLNAQKHASNFYEKLGYRFEGDVFMEAGIPHIKMIVDLNP